LIAIFRRQLKPRKLEDFERGPKSTSKPNNSSVHEKGRNSKNSDFLLFLYTSLINMVKFIKAGKVCTFNGWMQIKKD
jgi:hypothetical protein